MLEGLKLRLRSISAKTHAGGILIILLSIYLLSWHLGSWTSGLGPNEVVARQGSQNFQAIADNPLAGPQKILQYGIHALGGHSYFFLRLSTALITLLAIICFYFVVRNTFAKPAAVFGTLFFLCTPWLMVAGRQASAEALFLVPVIIAAVSLWFIRQHTTRAWLAWSVTIGLALYVPGLIWLVLPGGIMLRKRLVGAFEPLKQPVRLAGVSIFLLLLIPLVIAFVRDWHLLKDWLLIPHALGSAIDCFKNIGWAGLSLVWHTPQHFSLSVGRWPMLDALQLVMLAFGAYALWDKARQLFYGLAGVVLLAVLASGINRSPAILLIALPPLAFVMTAGFRYLYIEWRTIFPRNPIPQVFALLLLAGVVGLQVAFGWRYTLDAWPHSPETKSTYVLK